MQITKYSILCTIAKIIEKYGKNYSYASTANTLELLSKYQKIEICERTYYQHMEDLRNEGLIKSQRRYGREQNGRIYNRTSAVCITIKGYLQLAIRGWKWALNMAKKLRLKFKPHKKEQPQILITTDKESEKKESDSLQDIVNKAKQEGVSLYTYLLGKAGHF